MVKDRATEVKIPSSSSMTTVAGVILSIALAAAISVISKHQLSPTYGSIPASLHHEKLTAAILTASVLVGTLRGTWQTWMLGYAAASFICYPLIAQLCTSLGPEHGPWTTELFMLSPLLYSAVKTSILWPQPPLLQDRASKTTTPRAFRIFISWVLFKILEPCFSNLLSQYSSMHAIFTRRRLWYGANLIHALIPSKPGPRWLRGLLGVCMLWPWESLNASWRDRRLTAENYKILDVRESITGYVSVIENTHTHMRALRCDHSLLGGVWLPEGEWAQQGVVVPEPIYSVFTMLEAVRLMELPGSSRTPKADKDKSALVIGLGIGTAPSALAAHGVHVTAVELDPAVTLFARAHFSLSNEVIVVNEDALTFIAREQSGPSTRRYDHIIHDVFTGGAEPLELFTLEFLAGLRALLIQDGGTIAINYVAELPLRPTDADASATARVLHTTMRVFADNCRAFRDNPPSSSSSFSASTESTNLILFCATSSSPTNSNKFTFRAPTKADFLRSQTRARFLAPRHDAEVDLAAVRSGAVLEPVTAAEVAAGGAVGAAGEREVGAMRHWRVMRGVLEGRVWDLW